MQGLAEGVHNGGEGCQARLCRYCSLQLVHPRQLGGFFGICLPMQNAVAACTSQQGYMWVSGGRIRAIELAEGSLQLKAACTLTELTGKVHA